MSNKTMSDSDWKRLGMLSWWWSMLRSCNDRNEWHQTIDHQHTIHTVQWHTLDTPLIHLDISYKYPAAENNDFNDYLCFWHMNLSCVVMCKLVMIPVYPWLVMVRVKMYLSIHNNQLIPRYKPSGAPSSPRHQAFSPQSINIKLTLQCTVGS